MSASAGQSAARTAPTADPSAIIQTVQSELYRLPLVVSRQAVAWAWLGILGAALVSGLIVRRRLDRLDLVAVLKVRE